MESNNKDEAKNRHINALAAELMEQAATQFMVVIRNTRRVRMHLASAYPCKPTVPSALQLFRAYPCSARVYRVAPHW